MGEEMEWDSNTILSFLKDLEGLPILWDVKSPQHKMAKRKSDIWSQLAKKYNCPPDELKRKWQSLQAAYRRERTREAVSSGQYKSRWFAYNHMNFVGEKYRPRLSHPIVETFQTMPVSSEVNNQVLVDHQNDANQPSDESDEDDEEEEEEEEGTIETHNNVTQTSPENRLYLPNHVHCFKRMKTEPHRTQAVNNVGSHAVHILNRSSPCEVTDRNEYTIFGEYVAKKLSKMDERLCAIVQHEIHNILFQAEMGQFKNCSFSIQESHNNSDMCSLHSAPTPSSTSQHHTVVNTIYEVNQ